MRDYPIELFWSDEDRCYVAEVPDLFSCSATGATPEEALAEVLAAKEAWLESARAHGEPIPEPSRRTRSVPAGG
ncbi:MAG TPA: type II toxin-antitoxin system HicB family antitoxin [Thermoanaerobaculia bacterium]|nr:type II toxin-antitoxin system HicB family antitoxin [Thermoanaerobaculia bacterium]